MIHRHLAAMNSQNVSTDDYLDMGDPMNFAFCFLLLMAGSSAFAQGQAHQSGQCTKPMIRRLLNRASLTASVNYSSPTLKDEIKGLQAELAQCEIELGIEAGDAFYIARKRLYCRSQFEDNEKAVGCGEVNFDGGDLYPTSDSSGS
jgi:hypothetical protein